LSIHVTNT